MTSGLIHSVLGLEEEEGAESHTAQGSWAAEAGRGCGRGTLPFFPAATAPHVDLTFWQYFRGGHSGRCENVALGGLVTLHTPETFGGHFRSML